MSTKPVIYSIYGVRLADTVDVSALEDDPGHCLNDGSVGFMRAGAWDQYMSFLAIRCETRQPGDYDYHSGEGPNEQRFIRDRWNSDLLAVVDRLGLTLINRPGWFTIYGEA